VSYFLGNDPDRWHPDVPVWAGVRYVDLYPGVDLELTSQHGRWTWQLVARTPSLAPSASEGEGWGRSIRLRVEGADALTLTPSPSQGEGRGGGLHLTTAVGEFTLPLLQATAPDGTPLDTFASLSASLAATQPTLTGNEIRAPFTIPTSNFQPPISNLHSPFSNLQSLQDNPADLLYATFLGGGDRDWDYAIAVDGAGRAYVTGVTDSADFPATPGAFDPSYSGSDDAFVARLNAAGTALEYATFLGGGGGDWGIGIAVDGAGRAYVTGVTDSADFPAIPGAFDPSYNGDDDAFVARLNAAGTALEYATFLGGGGGDWGKDIAVDGAGRAYVAGDTTSADFPATPGAFDPSHNGGYWDAFVARLNAAGTALEYAAFLGGGSVDSSPAIAVDGAGRAYVAGGTASADFPATPGAFDTSHNGDDDAFVARVNPAGTALEYATFLGGGDLDWGIGIAVDGAGRAYVTGYTQSADFPTTPGAFDPSYSGPADAFVARLNPAGTALEYATFLGGGYGTGIAVDGAGRAYVAGDAISADFPATPGAFDTSHNGGYWDAFVARLNAAGTALEYATFLGGGGTDGGEGIAVDGAGRAYVTGVTASADFPATPGAFDTSHNDDDDAFVAKLAMGGGSPTDVIPPAAITDLTATSACAPGTVVLNWIAPGDDGGVGTATDYIVRYAAAPIVSQFGWLLATDVDGEPAPQPAGTRQSMVVSGLAPGQTYYFAIVARDEAGNVGGLSNSPGAAAGSVCSISGRVTYTNNNPLPGVTISNGAGHTAVTDGSGNYTLSGLPAGTYTLTPSRSGYTFSPASRTVSVPPSATGLDFTATPIPTDLFIAEVEPIQAMEGATLIAGKRTAVRVRIGMSSSSSAGNVRVKIVRDGDEFSAFYPRVPENLDLGGYLKHSATSIDIPPYPPLLDVYFFPPPSFWPQTPGTYQITAIVEADGDPEPSNNQQQVEHTAVRTMWSGEEELHLFFAPIEGQQDYYAADWVSFVERAFPMQELNVSARYRREPLSLSPVDRADCRNRYSDYHACLLVKYADELFRAAKTAAPSTTNRVVGVAPVGWLGSTIAGESFDNAVFLDANAEPHVLAHELGHTYGLYGGCEQYDPDCDDEPPFVLGDRVYGGLDSTFREVKEFGIRIGDVTHQVYDFMGTARYEPPGLDRWVTLDTYERLITATTPSAETSATGSEARSQEGQPILVLGGVVKADGHFVLDSYYLLPDGRPTDLPSDGDVLIQLRGANDQLLYQGGLPSSVKFTDNDSPPLDAVPLAVAVPYSASTRYIVITLFGQEIDRRVVSLNPPTITILSPQPGQTADRQINGVCFI
jgi:hypothetical protein